MKALLKTKFYWLTLAIIICTLPTLGQTTAKELLNMFNSAPEMVTYNIRKGDSLSAYKAKDAGTQLLLEYKGQKIASLPKATPTYMITYYNDLKNGNDLLEIVFVADKQIDYQTYVYIAGQESQKLIPTLQEKYYRIRMSGSSLIYNFHRETKPLGEYDFKKKEFHYGE